MFRSIPGFMPSLWVSEVGGFCGKKQALNVVIVWVTSSVMFPIIWYSIPFLPAGDGPNPARVSPWEQLPETESVKVQTGKSEGGERGFTNWLCLIKNVLIGYRTTVCHYRDMSVK